MTKTLGVIPARGGSKGVPRKNIRDLGGKPLLAWTIEAALASSLDRVIVSSDDEEIMAVANRYGELAPFVRPAGLATDSAMTLPVVQHAVSYVEREGAAMDVVVLLQPTTPFRGAETIDLGLKRLEASGCDSLVSVVEVGGYHPFRMKRLVDGDRLINYIDQGFEDMRPRQELPPVYIREGSLYIARRHLVMEAATLVGGDVRAIVVEPGGTVNIDSEADFLRAEQMIAASRRT
ncbi:MAG: acylneuraminate cytidylyltransferase family protein [Proteobacteria bacterium]|nr:MAG: acylneuraminate cytidylyltransferase family protein [Pseudomonadota bacterium]